MGPTGSSKTSVGKYQSRLCNVLEEGRRHLHSSGSLKSSLYVLCLPLEYNQQDATFPRSIYFYKLHYMFQAVPPPIIRSTKLYIQRQVLSNQYCCLLQQATVLVWKYLTLYVQFWAPDDGRRNRLKHVEQFIEINRSRKRCILLVVL